MSRIVITATTTVSGAVYRKGDCVEASASLVTALGSAARTVNSAAGAASPTRDQLGEFVAASNSSP